MAVAMLAAIERVLRPSFKAFLFFGSIKVNLNKKRQCRIMSTAFFGYLLKTYYLANAFILKQGVGIEKNKAYNQGINGESLDKCEDNQHRNS